MKKTVGGVDTYYIPANYSGWYMVRDEVPEQQKLSYFTEDVGLNAYYSVMNHDSPLWMNGEQYNLLKEIRGEMYLYLHREILIRYNLERLSNGIDKVSYVDLNKPIASGYYPTMHQHNGLPFPQRPANSEIPLREHKNVQVGEYHQFFIDLSHVKDKPKICKNALFALFKTLFKNSSKNLQFSFCKYVKYI